MPFQVDPDKYKQLEALLGGAFMSLRGLRKAAFKYPPLLKMDAAELAMRLVGLKQVWARVGVGAMRCGNDADCRTQAGVGAMRLIALNQVKQGGVSATKRSCETFAVASGHRKFCVDLQGGRMNGGMEGLWDGGKGRPCNAFSGARSPSEMHHSPRRFTVAPTLDLWLEA
eukprot:351943-Chlamydomonas_euryale.AAC.9